jgi:glutamine amidotransferase
MNSSNDYGMGNLHSMQRKMFALKQTLSLSNPTEYMRADKIILPGVGHFRNAMGKLKPFNLLIPFNEPY